MSTFGKKSLVWWNYHNNDRYSLLRFNSTPKELQLQVLEKWYPIGMMVGLGDGKYNYKIVEYIEHLTYYSIRVELVSPGSFMNRMRSTRNPLALYPDPTYEKQIKRQSKINRII